MHNMNQLPHSEMSQQPRPPGMMQQHLQSPLMSALGGGMDGPQPSQGPPPGVQDPTNYMGGMMRQMPSGGGGPMRGPVVPMRQQPMMQIPGRLPPYAPGQGTPGGRPTYQTPPPPNQGTPIVQGRIVQGPPPIRQPTYARPGMPMSAIPQPQNMAPRQTTGPPPPGMQMGQMPSGASMPRGASPAPPRPAPSFQPSAGNPPPPATVPQVLDGKAALIDKSRLDKLVQEIDPRLVLDDAVKEALIEMSDEFVNDLIEKVCVLAQHRGKVSVASGDNNHRLEVRDAEFVLDTVYKMPHTPRAAVHVFGAAAAAKADERPPSTYAHQARLQLIRKTLRKS